jgi:hypothetical protein
MHVFMLWGVHMLYTTSLRCPLDPGLGLRSVVRSRRKMVIQKTALSDITTDDCQSIPFILFF